jgi:hypothetical protein
MIGFGLLVVASGSAVVLVARRLMQRRRPSRRRGAALLVLTIFLLAGSLAVFAAQSSSPAMNVVIGVEIVIAGLLVAGSMGPGKNRPPASRTVAAAIVAASAAVIVTGLLAPREDIDSALASLATAKVKSASGFGPSRRPIRCTKPNSCVGPGYVVFNSYVNNPKVRKEQPFLAVADPAHPHENVGDSLDLGLGDSTELTLRAYIDNNTYQQLDGLSTTDALDTHLRLALPRGAVYDTYPTLYLYARNARPKLIWDTVFLHSDRPTLLTYVPGSARLYRRGEDERFATTSLPGDLSSGTGLALGDWRADFRYSGFVTFKLRATPLPEPVRDPLAARAVGAGRVVYLPPTHRGIAAEPVLENEVREQFRCNPSRCNGPPFPDLNAYKNQPLLGDEADFVRATSTSEYGDTGVERYHTVAAVHPGDELKLRVTIDNSADPNAIGAPPLSQLVAREIRAHVFVPTAAGRSLRILAAVHAANTQPRTVVDSLPVRSDQAIRLATRPATLGVLTATGVRWLPHDFFTSVRGLFAPGHWGMRIARALPPSFSKVLYVEFYVRVLPG